MKKYTLFFLAMLLMNVAFSGGPWSLGKGGLYFQAGGSTINYNSIFNKNGEVVPLQIYDKVSDNTFQLYSEIGLSKKWTLKLNVPYKYIINSISSTNDNISGLSNVSATIQYNIEGKKWPTALGFAVHAPAQKEKTTRSTLTEYNLAGYDAFIFNPYFSIGTSKGKWYTFANIGAGIMTNNYSSYSKVDAEFGIKVLKYFWLAAIIDTRIPIQNNSPDVASIGTINLLNKLYVNNQQYVSYGAKVAVPFTSKFGFNAGMNLAALSRNAAAAPAFSASIYYKR